MAGPTYEYDLSKPLTFDECIEMDRAALAAGPVARIPDGTPMFLRYDDLVYLLSHRDAVTGFTQALEPTGRDSGPIHEFLDNFLHHSDREKHSRLRSLVGRSFAVRPIERMRSAARKIALEALDSLEPGRDFDVFGDFAPRVPLRVVCTMLGIDDFDFAALNQSLVDFSYGVVAMQVTPEEHARAERGLQRIYQAADEAVAAKLVHPGEDLLTMLVAAEQSGRLSRLELRAMVAGLLFAGTDTTRTLISLGMFLLSQHPEQLELLHRQPDLATSAVEEIFRLTSPATWTARIATDRIECSGVDLPPGTLFAMSMAAANLDPEQYSSPERFDIRRQEAPHLALGRGTYFCLGAALVRLEAQEVFRAIGERGLHIQMVGDTPRWNRGGGLVAAVEPLQLRVHA